MGRIVGQIANDEPDRLARMMNTKQRLIGVDVQSLDTQVLEKSTIKASTRQTEALNASISQAQVQELHMNDSSVQQARREWTKEVASFRQTNQGKQTTREWDLNRPDALRNSGPARCGDEDPRCGPSSLQKFTGEDLSAGSRTAAQMAQCKDWWQQQMSDKEAQQAADAAAKQALAEQTRHVDDLQHTMMDGEAAARRSLQASAAALNQELAQLRSSQRNSAREAELQASLAELEASLASPWLNEDPNQAASALSPYRVRKDHFKGMSPEQRAAIRQQQLEQMEASRAASAAAAANAAQAAAMQAAVAHERDVQTQRVAAFRRKQAQEAAEVLRRQMAEKTAADAARKELYANQVTDAFFAQFGTSHR